MQVIYKYYNGLNIARSYLWLFLINECLNYVYCIRWIFGGNLIWWINHFWVISGFYIGECYCILHALANKKEFSGIWFGGFS